MSPRNQLDESIRHLRDELTNDAPLSAEDRALLDRTLADVARHFDEEDEAFPLGESIYDELQDLAARIESSRPTLSTVLGRIIDALSQLGI